MRDVVFVAGLLAMLPFVFGRPQIGVLLWAWTAFLVPNAYLWGFARPWTFNMTVALVTLAAWPLSREPVRLPVNSTVFFILLFSVLGTLSAWRTIGNPDIAWREWGVFAKIMLFALVVASLMNTEMRIKALVYAIALGLGFHGVVEGLKFIASGGGHKMIGPGGQIEDNNHLALALLCTLPLVFFAYQQMTHRLVRLGIIGCGAVIVFAVVGTMSRGGLLGLAAMATWALLKTRGKFRYLALVVPIGIAVIAFAPDRWFDRMETITEAEEDYSFSGRLIAWKQNTLVATDRPILGAGFQAVQNPAIWSFYAHTRFHELDFIPTDQVRPQYAHAAHSIYFQVIGDLGFVGFAIFATLCMIAWRNSAAVVRKAKDRPGLAWAYQLGLCLQYLLVAYFVAGAALSMAYFELIYIVFALLATLRFLVERAIGGQGVLTTGSPSLASGAVIPAKNMSL